MKKNLFTVEWSPDGFIWESKHFEKYDTAKHFYEIMSIKYEPNIRIYEI